jgi:KipI family sensor histidine kinase inhibitor
MASSLEDSLDQVVRIRPYGERGYLLDHLSDRQRYLIEQALLVTPPAGLSEYVMGAENLLVLYQQPVSIAVLKRWLATVYEVSDSHFTQMRRVQVPVRYDGADLAEVAALTGLSPQEVVAIHSAPDYRVRMMGFAPGFPYLDGLDPRLHLERKASPRSRVEPGAVAIGGSHAGIYSVASPGGWHLLGHTDLPLFLPERARGTIGDFREIFAFTAGDVIQFVSI